MNKTTLLLAFLFFSISVFSQNITVQGYVYDAEQEHRLDDVQVNVYHDDVLLSNFIETDRNGFFKVQLPEGGIYRLELIRPAYQRQAYNIDTENKQLLQVAVPMNRLPGYEFLGTIKKIISTQGDLGEEVKDIRIEIYNHTSGEEELDLIAHPKSEFAFNFERGNRYTVMVRKKGFFTRRFDVLVNVNGCVLCFEGLGTESTPEILDGLTEGNQKGVVAADIALRPIEINKAVKLNDIYYDYNKWKIRPDARPSLDQLVNIMRATPVIIELGSHTDSRGKDAYNLELSEKRAQAAVDYIISRGIDSKRITARGYGETQLVNNCDDGTTCSEKEHQKNRRTTFKVTKMMTGSSFDDKTLKDIIEEERLNKRRALEVLKEE